jgi:hypothetical protein
MEEVLKSVPHMEKEHRRAVGKLNSEMAEQAVDAALTEVTRRFGRIDAIRDISSSVRRDLIANAELFLKAGKKDEDGPFPVVAPKSTTDPQFHRYAVNVMVGHPAGMTRPARRSCMKRCRRWPTSPAGSSTCR